MKAEFARLTADRKGAVVELRTAREMGDLSENAAYHVAKSKLGTIDSRLRRLNFLIKSAAVINTVNLGTVDLGRKVTLEVSGKTIVYELVGGYESDPSKGKISSFSPIGRALMGKRVGETVKAQVPAGNVQYRILKVE